jgi:hypothetical protein
MDIARNILLRIVMPEPRAVYSNLGNCKFTLMLVVDHSQLNSARSGKYGQELLAKRQLCMRLSCQSKTAIETLELLGWYKATCSAKICHSVNFSCSLKSFRGSSTPLRQAFLSSGSPQTGPARHYNNVANDNLYIPLPYVQRLKSVRDWNIVIIIQFDTNQLTAVRLLRIGAQTVRTNGHIIISGLYTGGATGISPLQLESPPPPRIPQ